jgi:ATP-dependent DNA helicase RecG
MLREGYLTNEMLRQWGVDRIAAGQVLRDLVDQQLAVKEGGRHYAQYVLDPNASGRSEEPDLFDGLLPGVDEALRNREEATAGELVELTGLSRTAVLNRLRVLTETGAVVAVGATRSPKRRYQWVEAISKRTR